MFDRNHNDPHGSPNPQELSDEPSPPLTHTTPLGEVRLYKEVVVEERTITVQVRRERLRVEHLPADRPSPVAPPSDVFQEKTIVVPLWEEEVVVSTRPVLREQVVVTHGVDVKHGDGAGEPGEGEAVRPAGAPTPWRPRRLVSRTRLSRQ